MEKKAAKDGSQAKQVAKVEPIKLKLQRIALDGRELSQDVNERLKYLNKKLDSIEYRRDTLYENSPYKPRTLI